MDAAKFPPDLAKEGSVTRSKPWQLRHQRPKVFWGIVILILCLLAVIIYRIRSTSGGEPASQAKRVIVAAARVEDVPVYLSGLGAVTPTYSVTVRTQINGQLLRVLFKEGQLVKTGDLLVEIDPRPYLAQLTQYQGQLARDQALLANAKIDLKRYQILWKEDSVAEQTMATQAALVEQYLGVVKLDQGLIESTMLNLTYCKITSPINGRVGLRLVDPGNYVQTSNVNGLAIINTLDPITVIFTLPEDNISEVTNQLRAGKTLTALAYDRAQTKLLATGTLLTIDNQIDPTTGTIKLRATFNNKDNRLFANQFVNIRLLVTTLQHAVVVPTAAIQYSLKGPFVYQLEANGTVSVKPIVAGKVTGQDSVITSGLLPGQAVVTGGADKLFDGARVTVVQPTPPPALADSKNSSSVRVAP